MTYGVPTDLATVLSSIQAQLVAANIQLPGQPAGTYFPASRLLITLAPEDEFVKDPPGDAFVVLGPTAFIMDQALVMGGGNFTMGTNGLISLKYWNRYTPGQTHQDDQGLDDPTYGILAVWRQILLALQLFSPLDPAESGNCILQEPMRWIRWTVKPRKPDSEWLEIDSILDAKFLQDLSDYQTISSTQLSSQTFTLEFTFPDGVVIGTGSIAYNATAADIEAALIAASSATAAITPELTRSTSNGNIIVTGGPLPGTPVVVKFFGSLAGLQSLLVATPTQGNITVTHTGGGG